MRLPCSMLATDIFVRRLIITDELIYQYALEIVYFYACI